MSAQYKICLLILSAGFYLAGCDSESHYEVAPVSSTNDQGFDYLNGAFPEPHEPEDNKATEAKFQLGRHLFYDKRLSGNQTQSCESCHFQSLAFTDGKVQSIGSTGDLLSRNASTLTNVGYNATYTWSNPVLKHIESQLVIPMFGEFPVELGINDGNKEAILSRFKDDNEYVQRFNLAFPNQDAPISLPNIIKSLAVFNRALISNDSDFDRGEMSSSAMRGQALFNSEKMECFHCHSGFNFTDSTLHEDTVFVSRPFFNTGLYNLDEEGSYPAIDNGLFEVTQQPGDKGKFRPPTLRNITLTAPYMHDGSIATLDEVLAFYAQGGRNIIEGEFIGDGRNNPNKSEFVNGFSLSEQEKADLIAFLTALTDHAFVANPRFNNPFLNEVNND
ncbi:di-heme enzyme [Psychromonas sp. psych-6C06]|uniref:methanobactin export MATE transporter MbnM n=1 Tax=Psychromonas sp. psych-6C06 TaxID=2058089 RepID=UPI000C33ACCF|nr:methanobactin export MATE transporter MbnM [Psychromonas sp. psych-6C06]PKF60598.1 di-heme enzyme [Psychromonas sp. psych-6C06]